MKFPETAKRLSYILSIRKMTAQELANKSGVGKSSISHYINGNNEPHNRNAGAMADVLHCDPRWLMGFDVPMEIKELTGYPDIDFEDENERNIQKLLEYAQLLNASGIEKLKERAEELTEMNKYRKEPEESNPANELKYICKECSEELKPKNVTKAALS